MTRREADAAIEAGRELARAARDAGIQLLGIGEMGIGNTTAASAIVAALTGCSPAVVTGRGTGVDDEGLARKVAAVERALAVNRPDPSDPIGVLAGVGGLEIAALTGLILEAPTLRIPVILDGFITGAAALVAAGVEPSVAPRLLASHRSTEPGHAVVLERLGLRPLLDLDLRLGEGTGAALVMPLIDAAVRIRDGMATFESAGVAGAR
jgi:nicotinate-nucleotide--dimethylbenzimidazole phosphoribosyltransferase